MNNNSTVAAQTFFFNKSQSTWEGRNVHDGRSNTHDIAKTIDIGVTESFVRNGVDNYFPFKVVETVKRSMLQSRAQKTITNLASGRILFQNPDGSAVSELRLGQLLSIYKQLGITHKSFVVPVTGSNYLFGGTPLALSFGSNGLGMTLQSVWKKDFKTFRLSAPSFDKNKSEYIYKKHFYHKDWGYRSERRSKKEKADEKTMSWLEWQKDPEKNKDKPCFIYAYDPELPLVGVGSEVNRLQSFYLMDKDELNDHYATGSWFSGTGWNYVKGEFQLSCFDIDDIENGLHASGIVKAYHRAYKDPESGEAKRKFSEHKRMIEAKFRGASNSGAIAVVPVAPNANGDIVGQDDYLEFIPIKTHNNKDRHEILDKRIKQNILSQNNAIYSELFGIRDEKSSMSEAKGKLFDGVKLLNRFVIKPLKAMLDHPQDGFLNMVNDILGIPERAVIAPDLSIFLNLSSDLQRHFMHPDEWYKMYQDFGLSLPTIEQQESRLIPAYFKSFTNGNL